MSSSPGTRRSWTSDGGSGPRGRRVLRVQADVPVQPQVTPLSPYTYKGSLFIASDDETHDNPRLERDPRPAEAARLRGRDVRRPTSPPHRGRGGPRLVRPRKAHPRDRRFHPC